MKTFIRILFLLSYTGFSFVLAYQFWELLFTCGFSFRPLYRGRSCPLFNKKKRKKI